MVNEPDQICGRKKEQRKIVEILVNGVKDCENLSVLPTIGVGGLGKTTLAQLVFNDEKLSGHFEVKLWVCVSDDFDMKAILRAIIESGTGDKSNLENLDSLQLRVREELEEKRFLLLLDDVWNENQEKWVKLKSILDCGSKGASVIVTTRMKKVADIMGTLPAHRLATLSEKKCWLLFMLRAFGKENDEYPNLEEVGRRIVKKCGGVPLAAKALGGLLRFKREEKEWARVEGSHLWDLPEEDNSILSVLSYRHLPLVLKRCFAYCALFPKDYVFFKEELIFHWTAHGCILSNGKEEVEDVGDQIWNELAVRSFFQEVRTKGRNTTFKMHDLVHDLAQSIIENTIPGTESKHESTSSSDSKTRQVQWREIPKVSTSSIALEVSSLTTITNYPRLRTLKLKGAKVEELDSEIGKLKHLRQLDLSDSSIRTLPRTFCNLCSLQILILNKCSKLESLPEDIRCMTNLRHIFLEGCKSLSRMPSEIGLIMGVDKEMDKLSNTLTIVEKVLEDKQFESKSIQNWLSKLNGIAFEIEDILDECATEVSKLKVKAGKLNMKKYLFKYKIARRIKVAVEKLDALAEDRHKFHLKEIVVRQRDQVDWRRETGSVLNEPDHIYGRDEEKELIVNILVNEVKNCENLSVLPIIGVGGLGKTTLAQFVYNDERVSEHFDTKLWVCVSDDFDLKAILKAIIESATGDKSSLENLDSLQRRLRQVLNEKRFLLILDDVWNENQENWVKLKSIVACGSTGTRLKKVADIMKTLPIHCLTMLSEEQCWLLFKLRAFGQEDDQHPNLETIGRRIVKKCGGVPLAAKALGGLMRFKREENEWVRVEESHVWDLPEEEISILPVLRLSYRHLPFVLKRCFAYCALFPKDYEFDKEKLIFHWMAHGCILSNGKEEVEDVGAQIWNELAVRSFFQEISTKGRNTIFKMHDLVHDLAQSILENKIPGTESKHNTVSASDSKTRQVQWRKYSKVSTSSIAVELSSLTIVMNCTRLRTLKLNGVTVVELPSAIGKLKHLRHLDLSHSSIHTLPSTFCCLYNLQILILSKCKDLKSLPSKIRNMTNLRHLFLEECESLNPMPYKIRELTCLKTLNVFIVGDKIGHQLDELEHLNLGGGLKIRHLERVQNNKNANLVEKPKLRDLHFWWERGYGTVSDLTTRMDDEKALEALEPHQNLATLKIDGFQGCELALWMKNMTSLTLMVMEDCRNCTRLPPFGDLPLLKFLKLTSFDALEYIVEKDENIGCQNSLGVKFPSLEDLHLYWLPNLKGLLKEELEVGVEMFPNLQRLAIWTCPSMILTSTSVSATLKNVKEVTCNYSILPSISSNLENLSSLLLDFTEINGPTCNNIPEDTLQGLFSLKSLAFWNAAKQPLPGKWSRDLSSPARLEFSHCAMESFLPVGWLGHLTSLDELHILNCREFVDIAEEFKHLNFLKRLTLGNVDGMISLPQGLQQIPSLQSLHLRQLHQLISLPDWLADLASLTRLEIEDCPKIESLPSSVQGMTNLRYLRISGCPELQRRSEKAYGEDWPKIAHIPQLYTA